MLLSILHSCLIQYSTEDEVSISLEKNSTTTPLFECGALPRRHPPRGAYLEENLHSPLLSPWESESSIYHIPTTFYDAIETIFAYILPYTSVPVFTLVFLMRLLHFEGQGSSNTHQQHEQQRLLCKQRLTNIAEQL